MNTMAGSTRFCRSGRMLDAIALIMAAITFCVLSTGTVSGFMPSSLSPNLSQLQAISVDEISTQGKNSNDNLEQQRDAEQTNSWTRRETLSKTASSLLAASALGLSNPQSALADAGAPATKQEILSKLAGIPTFCLVNGPDSGPDMDGVPFGIYNINTATATGFFFLNYDSAVGALEQAKKLDELKGLDNLWEKCKIKVVPLSVAIQLSTVKVQRLAINKEEGVGGIKVNTINNIVPSDDANKVAINLDTSRNQNAKLWETKGRVPLFYIPEKASQKSYYAFETGTLVYDYKRRHVGDDPSMALIPDIQLVELVEIYRKAQGSNNWESLRDFVDTIQPSPDSREAAIKLLKEEASANPKRAPYSYDKVYLVSSSK